MAITHSKVSNKVDASDDSLIRPSDWNAEHIGDILGLTVNSEDISYTLDEIITATTLTENHYMIMVNGTATITLPAAADHTNRMYTIKNIHSTGSVVIDANESETIDGEQTIGLNLQYQYLTIVCDGDEWFIIGGEYVKMEDILRDIKAIAEKQKTILEKVEKELKKINS